jgi:hypothetical protein
MCIELPFNNHKLIMSIEKELRLAQLGKGVDVRPATQVLVLFDLNLGAFFFLFRCHLIPPRLIEFFFVSFHNVY